MESVIKMVLKAIAVLAPILKKADSKVGIKETDEALIAMNEISLLCCKRFSDGVQFADFTAFWAAFRDDAEFKAKLEAGWDKRKLIPAEVKDTDIGEGLELLGTQVAYVPKFIAAFKPEVVETPVVEDVE